MVSSQKAPDSEKQLLLGVSRSHLAEWYVTYLYWMKISISGTWQRKIIFVVCSFYSPREYFEYILPGFWVWPCDKSNIVALDILEYVSIYKCNLLTTAIYIDALFANGVESRDKVQPWRWWVGRKKPL